MEEVTRELTLRDEEGLNQEGRGIPKGKPGLGWKRGRVWCVWEQWWRGEIGEWWGKALVGQE